MTQGADEIQRIPSPQPGHDPGPGSDHLVDDLDPEAIPFQRGASEDAEGTSEKRTALTTRSHMDELPGFDFGRNLRTTHDYPPAVLCDFLVGNDGRGNLNHNISFNGPLTLKESYQTEMGKPAGKVSGHTFYRMISHVSSPLESSPVEISPLQDIQPTAVRNLE